MTKLECNSWIIGISINSFGTWHFWKFPDRSPRLSHCKFWSIYHMVMIL
jgi:hypothetical protein